MNQIIRVLMNRDELSYRDARELFLEGQSRVLYDGEDPEVVLEETFGLEPDYAFDLFDRAV